LQLVLDNLYQMVLLQSTSFSGMQLLEKKRESEQRVTDSSCSCCSINHIQLSYFYKYSPFYLRRHLCVKFYQVQLLP